MELTQLGKARWVELRKEKQRIEPLKVQMWFFSEDGVAKEEVRQCARARVWFRVSRLFLCFPLCNASPSEIPPFTLDLFALLRCWSCAAVHPHVVHHAW